MQQFGPDLTVVDPGGGGLQTVHKPTVRIDAHMRVRREIDPLDQFLILLTAEIPVVALLGGRHVGIPGLFLVLGRRRRIDDGRVHQRARPQLNPLVGQMRVHLSKHRLRQAVTLQQVAEVQDRRLVRDPIIAQFDPGKAAHSLAVVEGILGHRVAQGIPVLQEIDPQHRLQRHRRPTALRPGFGVVRFNQPEQTTPRYDHVHLRQELLAPCLLLLHHMLQTGKGRLLRHRLGSLGELAKHTRSGRKRQVFQVILNSVC